MRLLELRKKQKMTQQDVANLLNVTQRSYSGYELGQTEPTIDTLCKLADFYYCSLDELVGRDTNMVNLNAIKPSKARMIEQILAMNELQELRATAYLSGLMGG